MRIRQGETKCNHTSNEKVLGSHKKKIFFFLEMVIHAHPCEIKFFPFSVFSSSQLHNLGMKNRINGTQRTEQSEVYGTKKEEKREKRRKLVQYFVPKCSYYLCPGTYLKWCQNPNFNTYTGYFSIQFFDCYFMVQIVKYSDFP